MKKSKFQKLFHWKICIVPCVIVFLFGLFQWKFDYNHNIDTSFLGYEWQWCAIVIYSGLFAVQVFLYNGKLSNFNGFVSSLSGILLGSGLYEIPFFIQSRHANWEFSKNFVSLITLAILLYKAKWKISKKFILSCIPLFILWFTYNTLPSPIYWIHRLSIFPILITVPLTLKS